MKLSFEELRNSYNEIKDLLEDFSGDKVNNLDSRLAEDLSLWGDDNYDFLVMFIEKYQLNHDEFDYSKYFLSEGELFNSEESLKFLIYLPFIIASRICKLFLPNKKNIFEGFENDSPYEQKDLTFGDLVAWKLKGEFCLRKELQIELKQ